MSPTTLRRIVLVGLVLATVALVVFTSGCSTFGEEPTDTVIARLHWYRDMPDFRLQGGVVWNQIDGPRAAARLDNLCGGEHWGYSAACVARASKGGWCVVYSLYSEADARKVRDRTGDTIYDHETRHCGIGMPLPGGWAHRETGAVL